MTKTTTIRLVAALAASATLLASPVAMARSGGGGVANASGNGHWHGGNGGNGGNGGWNRGGWGHHGYWGGWGYGPYWGGLGLGIGLGYGAIAYSSPYYGGYYGYPYSGYVVAPGAEYVVVDPAPGDRVVRSSGQPVPAATRAPDPIFYPKNGQSTAKTESDTQECNRWATTQAGAMNDASIFQRATFACMEGRGYTVR